MGKYLATILSILLLSGCAFDRKKQLERNRSLERAQAFTFYPIRQQSDYTSSTLTRNIAVGIALKKNASLQANFEHLGIARADLEKAGVFANPYLDAIFALPKDKTMSPALTFYLGILKISDLWLVPIRRKIAEDELEIVSWEVTTQALKVIRDTHLAYNACARAALLSKISQDYANKVNDLLTTDTSHKDDASLAFKMKIDTIKNRSHQKTTIVHLQQLLSITISPDTVFEDTYHPPTSEDILEIKEYGTSVKLAQHPTIVINQIRVTRAKHQLSYEQRRCIEDATVGFNYVNWFDGVSGSGPFFHMSFPIGDTTHADQKKALSMINQREHEVEAALQLLHMEAEKLLIELISLAEQIELVTHELLPHIKNKITHQEELFTKEPTIEHKKSLLSVISKLYEAEQTYINLLFSYHETLVHFDYTVGGGILKKLHNSEKKTLVLS